MKKNFIAFLSTDSISNEVVKSMLKQYTHQIDEYSSERDLIWASEHYFIFLLEKFHPTVRGGELIIKVKKNNPEARFFFVSELSFLLSGASTSEWKNNFFSFTQYLIFLDKKRQEIAVTKKIGNQSSNFKDQILKSLTEREKEIIDLLNSGSTILKSSQRLRISFHTVNNHVKRIYKKLGVKNRIELYSKIYQENKL